MASNIIDLTGLSDEEASERKLAREQARERRRLRMEASIDRLRLRTQEEIEERDRQYLREQQAQRTAPPSNPVGARSDALPKPPVVPPSAAPATKPAASDSPEPSARLPTEGSPVLPPAPMPKRMPPPSEESHSDLVEESQSDASDELYRVWHGDAGPRRGSNNRGLPNADFDWVGIRKRARECQEHLLAASSDSDDGEEVEGKCRSQEQATGNGVLPAHSILGFFRRLKASWVTTITDGVTTKEWRPPSPPKLAKLPRHPKLQSHSRKATSTTSHRDPVRYDHDKDLTDQTTRKTRATARVVIRRTPRAAPPPLQFVEKRWPPGIINLSKMFNPLDIKFSFETPFTEACECPYPCRQGTCPNGIMNVFCTPSCCKYMGKCGNGLQEHDSLLLVKRRGLSELAVITTDKIDAGVVLGEYRGVMEAVKVATAPVGKDQGVEQPAKRNSGYRYKIKRSAESHPKHEIFIDAEHMGGITRFMNHSCVANAVFEEVRNGREHTVVVVTSRVLLPGEEVTVHYGNSLWFICRCGERSCQHRDIQHLRNEDTPVARPLIISNICKPFSYQELEYGLTQ